MSKTIIANLVKSYRPELNGLRALAVLLVLLYHLDFEWMKGGFLGVDIFLVISGYFISKNILSDNQNNKFTFKRFYTKRLRRLFPALIFTIVLVLIGGYFLLTPASYQRLGLSSIFSALSASNFFFWSEAGYFDGSASTKPLLHMWSLSLEEQFYLLWPFLLVVFYKFLRKYMLLIILIMIFISIAAGELYFNTDRSATFFLLPFRMFEFMLGAASIWFERMLSNRKVPRSLDELLFVSGLVLMVGSAMFLNADSRMPGLYSLLPCVGAMFTIVSGERAGSSLILGNKSMEYIGKASYSIYLIHWPVIVYYKYWSLSELDLKMQMILGLGSILFGFMMWRLIENTFRFPKRKYQKLDPIWLGVPLFIAILCSVSYSMYNSGGWVFRFTGELFLTKEEILENRKNYWRESNSKNTVLKGEPGKGHIIIIGNSHAIDIIYALRYNGFEAKITSLQTGGKCYNFGTAEKEIDSELCNRLLSQNLNNPNWKEADAIYVHDDWPRLDIEGFRIIIKEFRKRTNVPIYVIGPKITYKEQVPDIVRSSRSIVPEVINEYAKSFSNLELKKEINDGLINEFKTNPYYLDSNIEYIEVLTLQGGTALDKFEIVSGKDLKFLYFDASHLTAEGSKEFGLRMKEKYPQLFQIDGVE